MREKKIINKGRCCEASSKAQRGLFFSGIYPSIDQLFVSSFSQNGKEQKKGESSIHTVLYMKGKRGKGNNNKPWKRYKEIREIYRERNGPEDEEGVRQKGNEKEKGVVKKVTIVESRRKED